MLCEYMQAYFSKCLNYETLFELLLQVCNEKLLLTTTHFKEPLNLKMFIFLIESAHYYQNRSERFFKTFKFAAILAPHLP